MSKSSARAMPKIIDASNVNHSKGIEIITLYNYSAFVYAAINVYAVYA